LIEVCVYKKIEKKWLSNGIVYFQFQTFLRKYFFGGKGKRVYL